MTPGHTEFVVPEWALHPDPAARWLADGFVQHLAHWVRKTPPSAGTLQESAELARTRSDTTPLPSDVAECAQRLSLATSAGHVCLPLQLITAEPQALARSLLECGIATCPSAQSMAPIVIDTHHRLYLNRYYELEQRLAHRIHAALMPSSTQSDLSPIDHTRAIDALARWFGTRTNDLEHQQFAAARKTLTERLVIISGGPGTGKTTTLVNTLAGLLLVRPQSRIALAAPTGKAAARMLEALAERTEALPEEIRERLPRQAHTVHRLIGIRPQAVMPTHHAMAPLPFDIVVVDEASMLDLSLATQLFEAIPQEARIILLGDKDQLAAVEAGAVFAELTCLRSTRPQNIVWLNQSYRFSQDSAIATLSHSVRDGDAETAVSCLKKGLADLHWIDTHTSSALEHEVTEGFGAYLHSMKAFRPGDLHSIAALHQTLQRFRVLCALRQGTQGVERMNQRISAWLQQHPPCRARISDPDPWYPGRAVMVTRNDGSTGLFNGDVGIALPDASGRLRVHFMQAQAIRSTADRSALLDGTAPDISIQPADALEVHRLRILPLERLPDHETAFAITVHKSQGSEFDQVLLVLAEPRSPVLTRELLYTGITRARRKVTLVASAQAVHSAIHNPTGRYSGLADAITSASNPPT